MVLVTSGDDEHIGNCLLTVLSRGSAIHPIALGSSVVGNLGELSRRTGGFKFFVPDKSNSNSMIDAFTSGTGDIFQQLIQLESMGENVKPHHQLKSTGTVDNSVGNDTTFLVTWQTGGPPEIVLFDPHGRKYYTDDFIPNQLCRLLACAFQEPLSLPCSFHTCVKGQEDFTYFLLPLPDLFSGLGALYQNTYYTRREGFYVEAPAMSVPPATVEAFVERDRTHFPQPVMIYASVRKGFYPILNASVTATVEPETGDPIQLTLFDDGAANKECHVIFHVPRTAVMMLQYHYEPNL
ncbi:hypothetical protein MC885_001143 [Smutsia gigantea]|nr:hypothetical protein MC885_001143 [Smutsia gigantea]